MKTLRGCQDYFEQTWFTVYLMDVPLFHIEDDQALTQMPRQPLQFWDLLSLLGFSFWQAMISWSQLIVDILRFFSFSFFPVWLGALVICVLWLLPLLDRTSRDFTAISQAMGSVNSCETPVLSEAPVSKDKATWFNEACQTREHQFRNQRLYKNKQKVS